MECGDYERAEASMARGGCAVGVQLKFKACLAAAAAGVSPLDQRRLLSDAPDLSDMDEISYWIHTKRAPCLMNYDNVIKKQNRERTSSRQDIKPPEEDPSPRKKKKKRKLSLLDTDSASSSGKRQNVYFEVQNVSQTNNRPIVNECKSDNLGSDVDFNIKNTSVGEKPKRGRLQKSTRTRLHKKNKVVTSTPKSTAATLRRSLRQAQLNNSHMNNSFEMFSSNGALGKHIMERDKNHKKEIYAGGDRTAGKRQSTQRIKSKNVTNGQLDDYSDVSGFTANYIRSTKVQAGKTPRKLRCKPPRNLAKEQDTSIVCVNKSVNTGLPPPTALDCSTDSSQNVLTLVTPKNNTSKLEKNTSLLKLLNAGVKKERKSNGKQKKANLNISFQSQSSGTSRYPKRQRNHTYNAELATNTRSGCLEFNNSDKKENPEDKVYRRRSRRSATHNVTYRENSVLAVSNSTEQMTSTNATPLAKQRKKRRPPARRTKKTINQSVKDALRDKSGFTACFSESDDSVPLVQRKYFCN